jgi:hypothetical protein
MTTNETPGPSGTLPDRYLKDISADELSANAPEDETDANRDARCERNRKRNERRRRLRESLPIRNLAEALDQTTKPKAAVRISVATVLEGSYRLTPTVPGHQPVDPLMVATAPAAPAATVRSSLTAILAAEAVTAGAPTTGLTGEPGAEATAEAEATRTTTPPALHVAALTLAKKIKELRCKKSSMAGDNDGFPAFSARLRNLLLPEQFKHLGITKYNAKQDSVQ